MSSFRRIFVSIEYSVSENVLRNFLRSNLKGDELICFGLIFLYFSYHPELLINGLDSEIKKVVIIGSGTMGSGIAAHLCNANIPVTLLDLKTEISEKNGTDKAFLLKKYIKQCFLKLKKIIKRKTEEIIEKNDGGMLIIDYGYADSKMHETLQAVNNHKYSNILENIGDSDITYNINFHSFEKFINQFKEVNSIFTNQKKFLTSMGILQRAEIISKNIAFSKKADLFYRVKRLILMLQKKQF